MLKKLKEAAFVNNAGACSSSSYASVLLLRRVFAAA